MMAAKRRLALPEIDDRIISFLDTNDCITCMRINSAWNSVALNKFLSRTFIFSEPQENENARSLIRLACLLQDPFAQEASADPITANPASVQRKFKILLVLWPVQITDSGAFAIRVKVTDTPV
ncbi:hypothetical protein BG006_011442 [Podila minutissima]|uniref:F-box domain-containing protein n=1 Tax=Podila minutissima TaxID=64525 RepID=A0A9P5SEQ6_9FUNG|nr:hypothetical protein BG006_011442 [Podila minutissima]